MRHPTASLVAGVLAGSVVLAVLHGQARPDARIESHAYYLFLAQPNGCEACYVPLLLTSKRLEDLAKDKQDEQCVVITTYERDSIVKLERGVPVAAADVMPKERYVRVRGRQYRYQEIDAAEVLGLLERPGGAIPISRTMDMGVPSADELADLIARFRTAR